VPAHRSLQDETDTTRSKRQPPHKDIAFEFASWVSVEFKLYLIKEFQRLKEDENRRLSLAWDLNRTLSKLNYRIHTDAVKANARMFSSSSWRPTQAISDLALLLG
jgi:hypothetical protein